MASYHIEKNRRLFSQHHVLWSTALNCKKNYLLAALHFHFLFSCIYNQHECCFGQNSSTVDPLARNVRTQTCRDERLFSSLTTITKQPHITEHERGTVSRLNNQQRPVSVTTFYYVNSLSAELRTSIDDTQSQAWHSSPTVNWHATTATICWKLTEIHSKHKRKNKDVDLIVNTQRDLAWRHTEWVCYMRV